MNYEEKYKEMKKRVLAIGQGYVKEVDYSSPRSIAEYIDPDLKESEDERIRKAIICGMNALKEQHKETFASIPINDCIAWLEKQDKQNSTDKVEPKFKAGDWVQIDGGHVMKILDVKKDALCYKILNWCGNESVRKISDIDSIAHLWTIQDAKYGDALQANKCTLIFDSLAKDVDGNTVISSWYFCDSKKFYGMGTSQSDLWSIEGVIPATKEQRDLLFQKMKEAGYKWDAEKKELKKIEQKPSWSEEDEKIRKDLITYINSIKGDTLDLTMRAHEWLCWLEKQKDKKPIIAVDSDQLLKILPPNHWKPSEEQLTALKNAIIGKRGPLYDLYFDLEKL